jgi:hypothetical protein
MSFKNKNAQDKWIAYRDKMSDLFEALISENLSFIKENNFADYLRKGSDKHFNKLLTELNNENFLLLEKIANGWFDFQDSFDALQSERIKRFKRFG